MLRSTRSPITCGFLPITCYQHQQWLTFNRVKPWNTAQPISSEVVLARNSSVEGETLRLMTAEYLSELSFVPFPRAPPACAQPRSHSCLLPSAVCLCYGLVTVPWGSTVGSKAWAPYLCSLCTFMTQSRDLDIPPDIWSSLEYVLIRRVSRGQQSYALSRIWEVGEAYTVATWLTSMKQLAVWVMRFVPQLISIKRTGTTQG